MPVTRTPNYITRLKKALRDDLQRLGITAEIASQRVPGTKLHRITIVSPKFAKLRFMERQGVAWKIVESTLSVDEQLYISMIVTMTPDEAAYMKAA